MRTFLLSMLCLLTACSGWALKPYKRYMLFPDNVTYPGFREETITTSDGVHLAAWRFQPKYSKEIPDRHRTVLIAGGDSGNMSNWLALIKALLHNGYSVVAFDYRGFGASDSFKINEDRLYYNEFGEDLKAAIRYTKSSMPEGDKLVLYGFSMGTILAARIWKETPADYFVAEGFILNPVQTVARLKRLKPDRNFSLPADAARHLKKVDELPDRMLVFAGTTDAIATEADAERLKSRHPNTIVRIFNGGHGEGFNAMMRTDTDGDYVEAINDYTSK